MKLTTKGRYAVMAMADLAANQSLKPVSLSDIALRQNISLSYLEQLFSKLKNQKLIKSIRGPSGGYILEVSSDNIDALSQLATKNGVDLKTIGHTKAVPIMSVSNRDDLQFELPLNTMKASWNKQNLTHPGTAT